MKLKQTNLLDFRFCGATLALRENLPFSTWYLIELGVSTGAASKFPAPEPQLPEGIDRVCR